MVIRVSTSAVTGIAAEPVEVEVKVKAGPPRFTIIGLADSAIKESRDRVLSAIRQCGFELPDQILVNLAPAELKKEGSAFDVALAVGILAASGQLAVETLSGRWCFGELSLDGRIKPVRGAVALTIAALQEGAREALFPVANLPEARLIEGVESHGFSDLHSLVSYLRGEGASERGSVRSTVLPSNESLTLADVKGQESAKRALSVAAAGGHNLLMVGPPGCGKSMLAERFASLLPPARREEMLEVVKIHSIAGLPIEPYLSGRRPFRSPHHDVSDAGLAGGGLSKTEINATQQE